MWLVSTQFFWWLTESTIFIISWVSLQFLKPFSMMSLVFMTLYFHSAGHMSFRDAMHVMYATSETLSLLIWLFTSFMAFSKKYLGVAGIFIFSIGQIQQGMFCKIVHNEFGNDVLHSFASCDNSRSRQNSFKSKLAIADKRRVKNQVNDDFCLAPWSVYLVHVSTVHLTSKWCQYLQRHTRLCLFYSPVQPWFLDTSIAFSRLLCTRGIKLNSSKLLTDLEEGCPCHPPMDHFKNFKAAFGP